MNRRLRTRKFTLAWVLLALLFGLAQRVAAQVVSFGAQKTTFYNQSADNTSPTNPIGYSELAFVNTTSASDATNFTLSDNGSFNLTSSAASPTFYIGNQFYATKSALDADFTAGDRYTFAAHGGSLAGQQGKVPIENDAYAPILYLTGTSFSAAKSVNPNASFTFSLGSTSGSVADTLRSFSIYDPAGTQVYTANYSASITTITISQATIEALQRNVVYTGTLANFNTGNETATGFLSDASNAVGFVTATNFPFQIIPEPGSGELLTWGLAGMTIALARRGRRARLGYL